MFFFPTVLHLDTVIGVGTGWHNTVWQFIPEVYDSIMEHTSIKNIQYMIMGGV